jgi:hypothetical protein
MNRLKEVLTEIQRIWQADKFGESFKIVNGYACKSATVVVPPDKIEHTPFLGNKIVSHYYNSSWMSEIKEEI